MAQPKARPGTNLTEFYREEFLKHRRCLEAALTRIISQLEQLSTKKDADRLVSSLLRKFNVVTGLSGWSDPKNVH